MKYKTEFFNDEFEEVSEETPDAMSIVVAYNDNNVYVGNEEFGHYLEKIGVPNPEPSYPDGGICSIGFCEQEQAWYGWSHRAIAAFRVGSDVKMGDCAFQPSSKEEFREHVENWFDNDMYSDLQFVEMKTGIAVSYRLVCKDGTNINSGEFLAYPEKWGKGAWTAETLEDAKEMAIAFADAIA